MTDIYDQHRAAFARFSAFVILKDGARVATVAFKFPADGAGRLYCYWHVLGMPMARGFAGGGGYDKRSAAAESAVASIKPMADFATSDPTWPDYMARINGHSAAFKAAIGANDGRDWTRRIEDAGYVVLQAA